MSGDVATRFAPASLAVLVVGLGLVLPATGLSNEAYMAKKRTLDVSGKQKQTGPASFAGNFEGKPWGEGRVTGTVNIPFQTYKFHLKKGTATAKTTGVLKGQRVVGTYKFKKGTGKYEGVKGKGSFTLSLTTGKYTLKGTVKY
jgi:hypothetical protein